MQYSDSVLVCLNASFDQTIWEVFSDSNPDVDSLTDVVSCYITFNADMLIPRKAIRVFANNKPWITSDLRRQILDKHSAFKAASPDYHNKQAELCKAIRNAKLKYKQKVESMFKQHNTRDAWKGLRTLTGQGRGNSSDALTNVPGAADRLNQFYARFDDIDFSTLHQQL
jgi:hypothetical protein